MNYQSKRKFKQIAKRKRYYFDEEKQIYIKNPQYKVTDYYEKYFNRRLRFDKLEKIPNGTAFKKIYGNARWEVL